MSVEDFNNGLIIGLGLNGITIAGDGSGNDLAVDNMLSSVIQLLVKYTGNSENTIFNRKFDESTGKYIYDCLNNGSRVVLSPKDEADIIYAQNENGGGGSSGETSLPFYVYQKYGEPPEFTSGFWVKTLDKIEDVAVLDTLPSTGTETWTYATDFPYYGSHCCASILNKTGYFIGGSNYPTRNRQLNTVTETWSSPTGVPSGDRQMTSAVIGHKIYVAGGVSYQTTLRTFDADTNVWTSAGGMPQGGSELSAIALDAPFSDEGYLYVFGSTYIRKYNPTTEVWTTSTSYINPTTSMSGGRVGSKVYLFGGASSSYRSSTRIYDVNTGVWSLGASMPLPDYGTSCAFFGDIAYVFGGVSYGTGRRVYNTYKNEWASYTDVPSGTYGSASIGMGNTLYMCSGGGSYRRKLTISLKYTYTSGVTIDFDKTTAIFYIGHPQKYLSREDYYSTQIVRNVQITPINAWVYKNGRLYDEPIYLKNSLGLRLLKE